jgi:hypothetical protein
LLRVGKRAEWLVYWMVDWMVCKMVDLKERDLVGKKVWQRVD